MDQPPSFEFVTPPEPAPEPPEPRRILGLPAFVIGFAAGVLVLVAVGAAAVTVFILAAGRGTVLDRMVPAGVVGYASANLDPPADEKLDLLNLSHKLPRLSTQQEIDKNLDDLLRPLGLTYSGDVKPWLGAQIVGIVGGGSKPDGAVLFDSKDDAAAQRAVSKLQTKFSGAGWHDTSHGGVTLQVGTQSNQTVVLAYFDHTLLVASSEALADEVIDTDQGKHARLDSTAEYKTITGRLPSSRLLTIFVDGHGLSGGAQGLLKWVAGARTGGSIVTPVPVDPSSVTKTLAAFKGFGFAVAARSDGLVADAETDVDTSKLPPDQQAIYQRAPADNNALRSVPASAVGVVGLTDLDLIFKSVTGQGVAALPPQLADIGPKLTGEAALEVEPDGQNVAFGAVIGTTDPGGLKTTVQQLAGTTGGAMPVFFATAGQDLLLASSPAELSRLQTAGGGGAFESAAGYRQAQSYSVTRPTTLFYLDVDGAFRMASSLGVGGNADFQQARTQWSAVHSLLITSSTTSARVHVVIS